MGVFSEGTLAIRADVDIEKTAESFTPTPSRTASTSGPRTSSSSMRAD